jgi:hypothetical protein
MYLMGLYCDYPIKKRKSIFETLFRDDKPQRTKAIF